MMDIIAWILFIGAISVAGLVLLSICILMYRMHKYWMNKLKP